MQQAIEVWSRLAAARPDDTAAALQVAELCRREALVTGLRAAVHSAADTKLLKTAESYYREAVRRSKEAPSSWEVLGEFLHAQGRSKEAVIAWSAMAAPPADTPSNWRRLAEVFDHYGYLTDARAACAKAVAGAPDDFDYHDLQRRLAVKAEDYSQATSAADSMERLAARPRQTETALRAESTWPTLPAGSIARSGSCKTRRPRRLCRRAKPGSWVYS